MRKILALSLLVSSVAVVFTLVSCGGSGDTATESQASVAAGIVAPAITGAVGGLSVATVDTVESGTVPVDYTFPCPTSGAAVTEGNVSYDIDVESGLYTVTGDLVTTFNSCDGTDTRCDIDYTLGGTVNSTTNTTVSSTTANVAVTQSGTVNVSGFATFDCTVDTTLSISYDELSALDDATALSILDYMTGTICGKTVAEIKTMIESTDAVYCADVLGLATNN